MDEERHVIDTPVGSLAVRVVGSGRPAVLWHSLFVDDRSWDRLAPKLAESRRLVIITGPGHGSSGDPGHRYTIEECADAARLVLERLGVTGQVDWVGNAWGGHIGVIFAADQPERCRSLVTFGTPVAALTSRERARTYLLLVTHRLFGPCRAVVDGTTKVLLSAHTRATDPDAVALVHGCLHEADRPMMRNAVVSMSLHRSDLTEQLRQITRPSLFVTGAEHHGFSPAEARAAASLVRHGQVAVVDDAAYLVPLEAPAESTRLVLEFWAGLDTGLYAPT